MLGFSSGGWREGMDCGQHKRLPLLFAWTFFFFVVLKISELQFRTRLTGVRCRWQWRQTVNNKLYIPKSCLSPATRICTQGGIFNTGMFTGGIQTIPVFEMNYIQLRNLYVLSHFVSLIWIAWYPIVFFPVNRKIQRTLAHILLSRWSIENGFPSRSTFAAGFAPYCVRNVSKTCNIKYVQRSISIRTHWR